MTKQGRRCNHATRPSALSRGCSKHEFPRQSFSGHSGHMSIHRSWNLSFRQCGLTLMRSLSRKDRPWSFVKNSISAACIWDSTFSVIIIDSWPQVRIGTMTNFKLKALRCLKALVLWPQIYKLTQNCVCFIKPCINLVMPSDTSKYPPQVVEFLDLLQCIAA